MPTKSIGKVKLSARDDGKTKLEPTRSFDASKTRRIAKGEKTAVASKARAAGVPKRA